VKAGKYTPKERCGVKTGPCTKVGLYRRSTKRNNGVEQHKKLTLSRLVGLNKGRRKEDLYEEGSWDLAGAEKSSRNRLGGGCLRKAKTVNSRKEEELKKGRPGRTKSKGVVFPEGALSYGEKKGKQAKNLLKVGEREIAKKEGVDHLPAEGRRKKS